MKILNPSLIIAAAMSVFSAEAAEKRPNILFISVDDLRPELKRFGKSGMITPHLDRLADQGTIFRRAYCQYAVCGPSRASLLSGLRPTHTRFIIDKKQPGVDSDAPGCLTLPKYFKQNGYVTQSLGKIYHDKNDDLDGWSLPPWFPKMSHNEYKLSENQAILKRNGRYGPAFECADVPDEAYPDGLIAQEAVRRIEDAAKNEDPYFLAVGFYRPHLPFNAPKKYWDLYPEDQIKLADNPFRPKDTPEISLHHSPELIGYEGIPRPVDTMDAALARNLIRGYRACVSYSDANIGKVLDALERTGQADNTVVVLWGDHGWHLGENSLWGKETNFERALRTTLLAVDPRTPGGQATDALVELVDIYPTLCELAGLPQPKHLEGTSFAPLLTDPSRKWKTAVFSCFIRPDRNREGWSVRNDRYRYTEWKDTNGSPKGITLFDLHNDPDENVNISMQPESEPVLRKMEKFLAEGWTKINVK
jgi:arylsulfatase A-like enzyme